MNEPIACQVFVKKTKPPKVHLGVLRFNPWSGIEGGCFGSRPFRRSSPVHLCQPVHRILVIAELLNRPINDQALLLVFRDHAPNVSRSIVVNDVLVQYIVLSIFLQQRSRLQSVNPLAAEFSVRSIVEP